MLSGSFEVRDGIKQGCVLSPILLNAVPDEIKESTLETPREIQWGLYKFSEDLDFADYVCLILQV